MTDHDDQTPTRADFRRAAALYLHRRHHDHAGVNTILADADNRQRCSALVLAAIDLAFQSPYALASPAGIAGLQRVADTWPKTTTTSITAGRGPFAA